MATNPEGSTRMCPGCGRIIPVEYNVCPYCGRPKNVAYAQPAQIEPLGSGLTTLLYVLSFFIPIAGIIAGIVLLGTAGDAERKHVGKICLILGILAFVVSYLLAALLYVLVMGFAS